LLTQLPEVIELLVQPVTQLPEPVREIAMSASVGDQLNIADELLGFLQ
jgi:hypothetical protein